VGFKAMGVLSTGDLFFVVVEQDMDPCRFGPGSEVAIASAPTPYLGASLRASGEGSIPWIVRVGVKSGVGDDAARTNIADTQVLTGVSVTGPSNDRRALGARRGGRSRRALARRG